MSASPTGLGRKSHRQRKHGESGGQSEGPQTKCGLARRTKTTADRKAENHRQSISADTVPDPSSGVDDLVTQARIQPDCIHRARLRLGRIAALAAFLRFHATAGIVAAGVAVTGEKRVMRVGVTNIRIPWTSGPFARPKSHEKSKLRRTIDLPS
jgi:K+-transporting ATPase c subunit